MGKSPQPGNFVGVGIVKNFHKWTPGQHVEVHRVLLLPAGCQEARLVKHQSYLTLVGQGVELVQGQRDKMGGGTRKAGMAVEGAILPGGWCCAKPEGTFVG